MKYVLMKKVNRRRFIFNLFPILINLKALKKLGCRDIF